jgi:glycine cleavage system H protein
VKQEPDGTVTVGITFHAQEALGDVVFVQGPEAGRRVKQGEPCGMIESVKAAADLFAPLSGEVLAVNTEVADRPERVNADPYGAWLFRLQVDDPAQMNALLSAAAYRKIVQAEAGKP